MAVYLTKKMLSKMNRLKYPYNVPIEAVDEGSSSSSSADHWQKLMSETNKKTVQLAKDMICRVCARSGCTPLSDKIDGCEIMCTIRSLTNVSIEADDSLPKYICTNCLESLKFAMNFKKTCEASDKKFRKILHPTGVPEPSYPYSKHDFQLILHQIKQKRMRREEREAKEQMRIERMLEKKSPRIKQFKCSPCDLIFPNKEKLMSHRRERQCMRRACDICGQLVLSITQHMRHIHKQSSPHKCLTCGKEFPLIARLKNHMLVHTNTFNFFCDLCPYKCKHKYYLVMHMRTHTGEKPYKCAQCPATFVNPSNLNKHKLTHQAKQFKCMLCDKAFRTNTALREHQEAAHMNIKHTCNYCGREFCYKSDLRKHEIRSHNRVKRDYVGGEPTYKQVERLQKIQETEAIDKWRSQEMTVTQSVPVVQPTYIDQPKEFITNHALYFPDVSMIQQQQQMVQQQTVELNLPELALKKDEVELYKSQPGIGYF
ncbi:zinc finger protein 273-like [Trichoplusia ni]|uniref:Zinc finger protein 273-like n=1 Tax=Trichoplusia ni TaxID=7111 RepID=A0A7E5V9E0_TRINI|nr:zinc finger protein 273-like [Trichoplusia ni]